MKTTMESPDDHFERIQRSIRVHTAFHVQCARVHEIDQDWGTGWSGYALADGLWRCYVMDGPGAAVRVGDRWQPLRPGRCHLVPPGCLLWVRMRGRARQLYLHVRELGPLACVTSACAGRLHDVPDSPTLTAVVNRCFQACAATDAMGALLAAEACFSLAIAAVCDALPAADRVRLEPATSDPALLACLAAMDADPAGDWSNQVLAHRCACHVDVLIRRFRRLLGTTPARWLWRRRLHLAADLLIGSSLSLDTIAQQAGFSDRSHLIRRFQAAFGCTPQSWRRGQSGAAGFTAAPSPVMF